MFKTFLVLLCAMFVTVTAQAADAPTPQDQSRQLWQLLDYVAVDYGGAVANGVVTSESEYAEMREFVENALKQAQAMPSHAERSAVVASVAALREAVLRKAPGDEVAKLARHASDLLLVAYPIPLAPPAVPDLKLGASLYQTQCASCHGATGHGDGPAAAKLDPKPVDFSDRERAGARSVLALYQVVSQGVSGTSMPAFKSLSDADRWAVAFYAGTLSHDPAMRERGAALWRSRPQLRATFSDLAALTRKSELDVTPSLTADVARDVVAFLRTEPKEVLPSQASSLTLARTRLSESLAAAKAGDASNAMRLGLSAYLDGFEPLEPALGARNKDLLIQVENAMLAYRGAIGSANLDQASKAAQQLDALFARVEAELGSGNVDPTTTFIGALTILLREGLEALLIVVGMIAFLKKADRPEVLRHVHAGWVGALLAGGLTWVVATYVMGISGASREVTEGLSSLFAAVVLLGVGLWMHQKSAAGRWQQYLRERLSSALTARSAWALFLLAFVAVYREVFETVLFYSALALDGNGGALLGGLVTGVAILAVVAWVLLRTSARMPIGKFFAWSSILVAVLAVVLAGKGISALQEAGWLSATPVPLPRAEVLGFYPSLETTLAQLVVLLIALAGFGLNMFRAKAATSTA